MLQLDELYRSNEVLIVLGEMMMLRGANMPPEFWSKASKGSSQAESMTGRLKMGMFTLDDFNVFFGNRFTGGYKAHVLPWVISQCLKNHLIVEYNFPVRDSTVVIYQVNPGMVNVVFGLQDRQPQCFEELVYGWNQILKKVRKCIFKISVFDKEQGETFSATGFSCWKSNKEKIILTAKHVIEKRELKEIKAENGQILDLKNLLAHEQYDLAVIETKDNLLDALRIDPGFSGILDEIITAGYPNTTLLAPQTLLFHKGEINGYNIRDNEEKHIAISAKGESGSSGGPVVNRLGMVAGMVTRETTLAQSTDSNIGTLFYWALSSETIVKGIDQIFSK